MQKSIWASHVSMAMAFSLVCGMPYGASADGTLQRLDYLPLEYIESDGTSGPYIDTLYRPTSDTKVSIDFAFQGSSYQGSNWIPLWGYRKSNGSDQFALFINKDGRSVALNFKTMDVQASAGINLGDRCVVSNDNTRLYVATPGAAPQRIIDRSDLEFTAAEGWTLAIFGFRNGSVSTVDNRLVQVRIYGFTIREGNTLVRDYIPVQRTSDGAVGLYDRVNETFSGNAGGSGTIGAGPQLAISGLQISGDPKEFFPVTPSYGYYLCEAGESYTFTAASSGMDAANIASADCAGWNLYRTGESSPFRTSSDAGETPLSCTVTYTEPVRLEWVWGNAGFTLDTTPIGQNYGSVTCVPANTGAYASGTVVTMTATADSGYTFLCWTGDVPGGFTTNATIAVSMDSDKACHPIYAGPWLYNGSNQITDGNWVLTVSRSSAELSVTAVVSVEDATALPLGTRVEDAGGTPYEIVSVTGFKNRTDLRFVTLPPNLRTLPNEAFSGCTGLESVTPLLPDTVTSIGWKAFNNVPVEGALRIGYGGALTLRTGDYGYGLNFHGTRITEIDAGPGAATLPAFFADGCTLLTNVTFASSGLTTMGRNCFDGCTSLRRLTPFLPDTVTSIGYRAFYNTPVEGPLRIGYGGALTIGTGDYGYGQNFTGTRIVEIDAGPGAAVLPPLFANNCTLLTNITFASSGLTTMGRNCFDGCTSLRRVTPLLPDTVTSIGYRAFYNVPVEGCLRIGYGGALAIGTGDYSYGQNFTGARISEIDAGPGCTFLRPYFADNCPLLTNVVFDGTEPVSFPDRALSNCPLLTNIVLRPVATWTSSSFSGTPANYYGRILYYKTNEDWSDAIVSYGTNFKSWNDDVTAAEKDIYQTAFPDGPTPRGYMAVSGIKKWFVPITGGASDAVSVRVTADPYEVGTPSPGYTNMTSVSIPAAFSVSQYGEREDIAYESTGYRLDEMGEETWILGEPVAGVRSFTFDDAEVDTYRVVWQWREAGFRLTVVVPPTGLCSVSVSGTELTDPSLTGVYYVSNTVVTLTATPAGGRRFVRWHGDVPEEQAASATIHLTMDRVRTVIPYVEEGWTYVEAGKTVTDGYWVLNVTGSASGHTISSVKDKSDACACLDLRKATDGFTFAQIGASAFANVGELREVRLPDTLTTIGNSAFSGCHALKTVTPFLPDSVTSIGYRAFMDSTVEGTLRIGYGGALAIGTGDYGYGQNFQNTRINEMDIGPGVTVLPPFSASNCTLLTNVTFASSGLTAIDRNCFDGCTSLRRVTPLLPDTVTSIGYRAFYNVPVEGCLRIGFGGPLTLGTGDYALGQNFEGTRIAEMDVGPGATVLPPLSASSCTLLTNVTFASSGLTTIDRNCFDGCTSLRRVTPLLPDTVTSIGYAAFQNAPVEGTLRIGFGGPLTLGTGDYGNGYNFRATAIGGLIAGPGVTTLSPCAFDSCTALASADFTESTGLATINGSAFYNNIALLDVWLNAYPTFGSNAFSGVPANARFHLAKGVDAWTTWLDNTANAKPWAELSTAERNAYYDFWGAARRPKARAVKNLSPFPKDSWLLRYSTDKATMVILR